MITSTPLATSATITIPERVFTSTSTGLVGGTPQPMAITTIALCNIGTPSASDETIESATVNIHVVKRGVGATANPRNLIVSNLTIPAGETVFFSDERIILDGDAVDGSDSLWIGCTSGAVDTAGSFVVGRLYVIVTTSGTNYTTLGALDSNPGTLFVATGNGAANGTGTARRIMIVSTVSAMPTGPL